MKKILLLATTFAAMLVNRTTQAQTKFHSVRTFHIGGTGGWDYLAVGPRNQRLYVSHGTQVNILDTETGDSVGIIPNTTGVHGIDFDPAIGKGFTSNGKLNNVSVFDLKTNEVTGHIPTGQNPDAILFEPFTKTIITCNGKTQDLSVIDPVKQTIIATIPVGGKPETAVSDEAGMLFVNVEDKSEIVAINLKTKKVEHHWSLAPGEGPAGLAIDRAKHRLFAGCEKLLIVLNSTTGKVVAKLPIGEGSDGVAFDATTKNIFSSNGEGTLTVIHEKNADAFIVIANVPTTQRARTLTIDPISHNVYLPVGDLALDPNAPKGKPATIEGTFRVLVYHAD